MQWADEGQGNHNPQVVVRSVSGRLLSSGRNHRHKDQMALVLRAKAGEIIRLDASQSYDPDNNALSFHWWQQPEIGNAHLTIDDAENAVTAVRIPSDASGQTLHLICEARDDGAFNLAAYQRIIIRVSAL